MTYDFESLLKISEKSQWTTEEMVVLSSTVKPLIEFIESMIVKNNELKEQAGNMEGIARYLARCCSEFDNYTNESDDWFALAEKYSAIKK